MPYARVPSYILAPELLALARRKNVFGCKGKYCHVTSAFDLPG
jgi:hypothetical protein